MDQTDFQKGFFGEIITAMISPMKKSNDNQNAPIDFESAAKLAVHLINNGSDSLVLSGTTGEAPATHVDEKAELISKIKSTFESEFPNRKIPLIAGTGSNDTAHAIRNAERAKDAGADAQLVVTPYYSRPSQAGVLAHFEMILEKTDLPVILYDVPARSGVKIQEETYLELAKNPKIVAIKDATGNVFQAGKTIARANQLRQSLGLPELTLYSGDDSLLLPFLSIGAKGVISVASHLIGTEFKNCVTAFRNNEMQSARDEFMKAVFAIDLLNGAGQQAAASKAAMQAIGLIESRQMRLPNLEFTDDEYRAVCDILRSR